MKDELDLFKKLKENIQKIDPVSFCENYLTLDRSTIQNQSVIGFKPFADIYRYIGVKALEDNSKPVVLLKSRQTGRYYYGFCSRNVFYGFPDSLVLKTVLL